MLVALGAVAALTVSCGYLATYPPVEDEDVVRLVSVPKAVYDHPVRLSSRDLSVILQAVRVKFKANWLQTLITGPLAPLPLFDEATLARVVPPLAAALERAGLHERVVFYVAQRRSNARRDVTSGVLFVEGRLLHIVLANHQNRVDAIPGSIAYDKEDPEVAVAPQRVALVFDRPEFVVERKPDLVDGVFGAAPPRLLVDYGMFLKTLEREAAIVQPSPPTATQLP
jgi:hypothetical protein